MTTQSPARAYLFLIVATFFFGSNVVAGKLSVGEMSPMAIVMLRWVISATCLAFIARKPLLAEWRVLLARWPYMLAMGGVGFTVFNVMFYAAAHSTSAVNMAIIQGATPIVVLLVSGALLAAWPPALQWLGAAITVLGVVVAAAHGSLAVLLELSFNRGDLLMIAASIIYAVYTVGLRWRPPVSPLVFIAGLALAALLTSIPLAIGEAALGQFQWPTPKGWLILLFIGLFPSLLCQLLYLRSVELIGAARAGVFYNLVPIFGIVLSVAVAHEPLRLYAVVAIALVIGGIAVSEIRKGA
jgi:drug/metabolite transporter (DMT)-like permease